MNKQENKLFSAEAIDRIWKNAENQGLIHVCVECGHVRGFSSPVAEICEYCDEQLRQDEK